MLFIERTKETGYSYECKEIFGELLLESTEKLDDKILDKIVVQLIHANTTSPQLKGSVKVSDTNTITYVFTRAPQWSEDDEDQEKTVCYTATPTLTSKRESVSTRIRRLKMRITNWFKAFAEAYREASKKNKNY